MYCACDRSQALLRVLCGLRLHKSAINDSERPFLVFSLRSFILSPTVFCTALYSTGCWRNLGHPEPSSWFSRPCSDIQSRATRVTSSNSCKGYRARLTSNVRICEQLIETEPSWLTRYDGPIEFTSEILIEYLCVIEDKQINQRQCFYRRT